MIDTSMKSVARESYCNEAYSDMSNDEVYL